MNRRQKRELRFNLFWIGVLMLTFWVWATLQGA